MGKLKEIFTNWRVLLMLLVIIGAVLAINPKLESPGVEIASVLDNSSAQLNGVRSGEIIYSLNGATINSLSDFTSAAAQIAPESVVKIRTEKTTYSFIAEQHSGVTSLGIDVKQAAQSNLKKGLDLVGGIRVLLEPEEKVSLSELQDIIAIAQRRLNVYGLSDVSIRQVSDLDKNNFIQVEMAGATQSQVTNLITQQGKFEAKINNQTVFIGGIDIRQVGRSVSEGAGIETCGESDGGWVCKFRFPVTVSKESARLHADITRDIPVSNETQDADRYLVSTLDLYLDDSLVSSLYISDSLRGIETPTFTISGSGGGATQQDAAKNTLDEMKNLQTVLITGSLPVKLKIAKLEVISPTLGENFFKTAITALLVAIAAVGVVLYVRYRNLKITALMMLIDAAELTIILGCAALIKWNLDLAAIAGIIAAIGTGVDDQIVIMDEISGKATAAVSGWKEKVKRAFFIILGAYGTTVVAMIPLWAMGAGMLRGFAIVTIIGASSGVFITRPAFAKIAEILFK